MTRFVDILHDLKARLRGGEQRASEPDQLLHRELRRIAAGHEAPPDAREQGWALMREAHREQRMAEARAPRGRTDGSARRTFLSRLVPAHLALAAAALVALVSVG